MAVDAPLLTRQRVLAAKVETTTGTAESLSASEAAFNVFNMEFNAEIPFNERQGQASLSPLPGVPGARMGKVTFETEVVGKGSSGVPSWGIFLQAAGFVLSSVTYNPETGGTSPTTLTIGGYQDGIKKVIAGAVGDWTMTAQTGSPGRFKWDFQGAWSAPTDVALLTPTYPTVLPPRFAGGTLTIASTAYKISQIEIACGNTIAMRQNPANASGYHAGVVTNRRITVKLDPEASLLATKDWYADHLASTEVALSCVFNGGTNNTITFTAPKMQLINPPQDVDRDGILAHSLEFQCNRNTSGGDNELSVAFS